MADEKKNVPEEDSVKEFSPESEMNEPREEECAVKKEGKRGGNEQKSETKNDGKGEKKLKAQIEELKKKLSDAEEKLVAQSAEADDKYARLAAEYDNFRKRTQKDKENIYCEATTDAIMGLVPILDNLMYADKFGGGEDNPEKFAEGVRMILSKLPETLEKMNVTVFGEAGEKFDPEIHNAVMHVDDEGLEENVITDVLQCGYKYGDRVIRYAMVRVAN